MPGKKGESATAEREGDLNIEKPTETTDKTEDSEDTAIEDQDDSVENKKRGRGRPKKSDAEPVAKTPKREKKVKESTPPSRTSRRLSNQKTGKKLPNVVEEEKSPKKRNIKPKSPKKAEKNVEQNNKEVAETKDQEVKEEETKAELEQSTNGTPEIAASS